ncbi:hypothetical protein J6590_010664 [Homalodisca vitripennis]|nr:hypothetical protein J6590_010664 [Homalodisca vitripennis]
MLIVAENRLWLANLSADLNELEPGVAPQVVISIRQFCKRLGNDGVYGTSAGRVEVMASETLQTKVMCKRFPMTGHVLQIVVGGIFQPASEGLSYWCVLSRLSLRTAHLNSHCEARVDSLEGIFIDSLLNRTGSVAHDKNVSFHLYNSA